MPISEVIQFINNKISTHYEKNSIDDTYYIATSGIQLQLYNQNVDLFTGFSCQKNLNDALNKSKYEIFERSLSTYLLSDHSKRDSTYNLFNATNNTLLEQICSDRILLGPTPRGIAVANAIGLSFHSSLNNAIKHSVFELIERLLLARIWYERNPITIVDYKKINSHEVYFYTMNSNSTIPFIMSVLVDESKNIMCVGASMTDSFDTSIEKSYTESIMLMHSITQTNIILGNVLSKSNRSRIMSQLNPLINKKRWQYLSDICITACKNYSYSLDKLLYSEYIDILKLNSKIFYSVLHSDEQCGHIVRAISNIPNIDYFRKSHYNTENYILDPIC